jgi:hypothetical protein
MILIFIFTDPFYGCDTPKNENLKNVCVKKIQWVMFFLIFVQIYIDKSKFWTMHGNKIEENRLWRNAQYSAQHSAGFSPNTVWFYRLAIKPGPGIHHRRTHGRGGGGKGTVISPHGDLHFML